MKDINDFITIVRQKNGRIKITHDVNNEANIYKFLHELGFRKSKIDKRNLIYRRVDNNITPVSIREIKRTFLDLLRNREFINIPEDINYSEILNWFHVKKPIKQNGLFDHYLEDELIEIDLQNLKIKRN